MRWPEGRAHKTPALRYRSYSLMRHRSSRVRNSTPACGRERWQHPDRSTPMRRCTGVRVWRPSRSAARAGSPFAQSKLRPARQVDPKAGESTSSRSPNAPSRTAGLTWPRPEMHLQQRSRRRSEAAPRLGRTAPQPRARRKSGTILSPASPVRRGCVSLVPARNG